MSKPRVLILRTAGTNCDLETAHAFELAGASTERVHINRLLSDKSLLDGYQILAFPGGFSYGDDIAAGRILAAQVSHYLEEAVHRFIDAGKPIIGICNGFQVLVKTSLLPGPLAGETGQTCTLAHNDNGRFTAKWVRLAPVKSRCVWTEGLDPLELPIAHGEGRFVPKNDQVRRALWDNEQVALVYANPDDSPATGEHNPNGSIDAIAGVCDATGLVFGLMPHPERFVDVTQHPAWSRMTARSSPVGAGLHIFKNAVAQVHRGVGAGV
jgi:phosphoribosylformylglycinamidine synthase subunit PurQ / glutaminase